MSEDARVNRAGESDSVDRETDSVSWCCPESGSRILGLFVLPVTWCHCDRCSTRCVPYGQLGSDGEKGLFYKTQIVTRSQIKYCCLWKKNELKIRAISILVQKKKEGEPHSRETGSPSSLIERCQQQPSHLPFPPLPDSPKWKADYCLYSKVARQSAKTILNSGHCSSLFALTPTGMRRLLPWIEPSREIVPAFYEFHYPAEEQIWL